MSLRATVSEYSLNKGFCSEERLLLRKENWFFRSSSKYRFSDHSAALAHFSDKGQREFAACDKGSHGLQPGMNRKRLVMLPFKETRNAARPPLPIPFLRRKVMNFVARKNQVLHGDSNRVEASDQGRGVLIHGLASHDVERPALATRRRRPSGGAPTLAAAVSSLSFRARLQPRVD